MKRIKIFYTMCLYIVTLNGLYAQNPAIFVCNDINGGIQIHFDHSQNCPVAAGSLEGYLAVGFHSGINDWDKVVSWEANNAIQAEALEEFKLISYIPSPEAYYGEELENITEYNFIFNLGANNPDNPWASLGMDLDNDGDGSCDEFRIEASTIQEVCPFTLSNQNLNFDLDIKIAPNPFSNTTQLRIGDQGTYDLLISDLAGRTIRQIEAIEGPLFELERDNMPAGIYYATFINERGAVSTHKLVIQ